MSIYIGANLNAGFANARRNTAAAATAREIYIPEAVNENVCRKRLLLSLFAFFLVVGFQLFLRVMITQQSYNIESTRKLALENDEELRSLKLAYNYYKSPIELARSAHDKLGMEQAAATRFIKLSY